MSNNVNAEIITIGTEILLGEITDTNSVFIARVLRDLGINLYFMTSVGDNERRIADAIRIALSRAQVVITCGGLGPTVDDMTRQGVAAATNRELEFHQSLLDKIAERFSGFRTQMTENNRRQAYIPAGAIIVDNPVGTAPAFIVEHEDKAVISLPGVPREMKFLLNERIVPYLRERYALGGQIIKARVLRTAGVGESALDEAIGTALLEMSNPTIGLAAHSGQVDVRITAKADTEAEADEQIARVEAELRARIGAYIFGVDEDSIEDAVIRTLKEHGIKLAFAEAGVGRLVSSRLAAYHDAEAVLLPTQEYADLAGLAQALGLDPQTSIRALAEAAAQHVQSGGAGAAVAVVSRSSASEDHADNAEMSAIAVCVGDSVRSRAYGFGSGNETAQNWLSTWALSMVWRMVQDVVHS